jgi:hypothetical protein
MCHALSLKETLLENHLIVVDLEEMQGAINLEVDAIMGTTSRLRSFVAKIRGEMK